MEKKVKFALAINQAIVTLFDKENDFFIGELKEEDLNDFFYALMVITPNRAYNKITGDDLDILDTLAIAQKLVITELNNEHAKKIEELEAKINLTKENHDKGSNNINQPKGV